MKKLLVLVSVVMATLSTGSALAVRGGGNVDCPAGSVLLTKYNFVGGAYVVESGAGVVTISNGTATGGSFTVNDATKVVTAVIVKGSTDSDTVSYNPGVSSGTFSNAALVNNGGNIPDVSNVKFCGGAKTTTTTNGGSGGGSVLGSGTPATPTTPQVNAPVAGVNAGNGGAASSLIVPAVAFSGSVLSLGYGLLRLRKLNV